MCSKVGRVSGTQLTRTGLNKHMCIRRFLYAKGSAGTGRECVIREEFAFIGQRSRRSVDK